MQVDLNAATSKMKDAESAATSNILTRAQHLGTKLQGAFKELATAVASEDYILAAPAIYEIGSDMVQFYSEQDGLNDASLSAQEAVVAVQNRMNDLKASYDDFLRESRAAEDTIFSQRLEVSRAVLQATHDLQDQQIHVLVEFEDMLRASLIAYVADRSTALGQLPGQLNLIADIVTDFQMTPMYNLPNLGSQECGPDGAPGFEQLPPDRPIGCTFFTQTQATAVLLSSSTERLPDFPVVIVDAGTGSFVVPMKFIYAPASLHWADPGIR